MFAPLLAFIEQRFAGQGTAEDVPREALRLATAALLVEMARADFEEDDTELERAGALLAERYGLDEKAADELLAAARDESDRAVSLFRFTHLINQQFAMPDKLALMGMLWEVAYADGRLDKHEDALMHKLAELLYVPSGDLMLAKEQVRKKKRVR